MKRILIANCILLASAVAQASPQVDCLAKMAYVEARGINKQAVKDVTDVMFNRIKHHKFPDSVCKNINKKGQYTWAAKGSKVKDIQTYKAIYKQVDSEYAKFKLGTWKDGTNGAMYFNNRPGKPYPKAKFLFKRNGHYFYK